MIIQKRISFGAAFPFGEVPCGRVSTICSSEPVCEHLLSDASLSSRGALPTVGTAVGWSMSRSGADTFVGRRSLIDPAIYVIDVNEKKRSVTVEGLQC